MIKVLFHDNCFDGMASAGLFAAFYRQSRGPGSEITFDGLSHAPGGGVIPERLTGDENVIVDFRYSSDPRLTWWFDHHRSAFLLPEDEAHFRADDSGQKYYDPTKPSCAGFMAQKLAREHGFDTQPHAELIEWADMIDGARFPDARTAVELDNPALKLTLWIENSCNLEERIEVIEALIERPMEEVIALPLVADRLGEQLETGRAMVGVFRERCVVEGNVVFCDLTAQPTSSVNKFVPYYLYPDAAYAVVVSRTRETAKVSVGYNAWHPSEARGHDISRLCERNGGGGHPYVGAVTRVASETQEVVRIAREMVAELNR